MERSTVRHRIENVLIAGASVTLILLTLAALDDRVRTGIGALVSGEPVAGFGTVDGRFHTLVAVVSNVARDQASTQGALVMFGIVAAVLVVMMLRT